MNSIVRTGRIGFLLVAIAHAIGCASVLTSETARHRPIAPAMGPASPSLLYPGLFEAVAKAQIFEPKDWVDALPKTSPREILAAWHNAGRPTGTAHLEAFVSRYFDPPKPVGVDTQAFLAPERTMVEHIDHLWSMLTRDSQDADEGSSILSLPYAYIVPGGRFREVYYWDSYFTLLGAGRDNPQIVRTMIDNFAAQLAAFGFIPNGNRSYYLSRSQPPLFFMMVSLLDPVDPARGFAEYLDALKIEHAFWMAGEGRLNPKRASAHSVLMPGGEVLNRYFDNRDVPRDESYVYDIETASRARRTDPVVYRNLRAAAESGWDFSSRWFGPQGGLKSTRTLDIVPVDLNALLYGLEMAISRGCVHTGEKVCARDFEDKARVRARAMRKYLWFDEGGYFTDYDFRADAQRKQLTAATVYPLFFGIVDASEAKQIAEAVRGSLLMEGGIVTTLHASGEQWDAPNGWAPLQWLAVQGFAATGSEELAETIARRWVKTVARGFCESGKLVEKYNVVTPKPGGGGEYPTQDGFGWTNGVTIALLERFPALRPLGKVRWRPDAPETCHASIEESLLLP